MARSKRKKETAADTSNDCYFDDLYQVAHKQVCENDLRDGVIVTSAEAAAQLLLLPVPALSVRYLMRLDGWPLSRFVLGVGTKETCKSAFAAELCRWHRLQGGLGNVIEVEFKDAARLRDSICNYDRGAILTHHAFTQEEWCMMLSRVIDSTQLMMDGKISGIDEQIMQPGDQSKASKKNVALLGKPRGRIAPVAIVVDSISAATIEKFYTQAYEEGVKQNHPVHAKYLAEYMRVIPKRLHHMPVSVFMISHLKKTANPVNPAIQTRTTHGGTSIQHQITMDLEFTRRSGNEKVRQHKHYGTMTAVELQLATQKNSLGQHSTISVDFCWYFDSGDVDPLTGHARQKSFWDWYASSIDLLIDCQRPSSPRSNRNRAKSIYDLVQLEQAGEHKEVWSPVLDIPESSPLPFHDAGILLEQKISQDPSFRIALYDLLGIQAYPTFRRGVCALTQIQENMRKVTESIQTNRYAGTVLTPDQVRQLRELVVAEVVGTPPSYVTDLPTAATEEDDWDETILTDEHGEILDTAADALGDESP